MVVSVEGSVFKSSCLGLKIDRFWARGSSKSEVFKVSASFRSEVDGS
jgi:hypothetical protein